MSKTNISEFVQVQRQGHTLFVACRIVGRVFYHIVQNYDVADWMLFVRTPEDEIFAGYFPSFEAAQAAATDHANFKSNN